MIVWYNHEEQGEMGQSNYPCGGSEDSKLDLLTHSVCKIKLQINYTIKYELQLNEIQLK